MAGPGRPKKETAEEALGLGDASMYVAILEEGRAIGENIKVPTRRDINQQGVDSNFYRGDLYLKDNPKQGLQTFRWAPPRGDADQQAYAERAELESKGFEEVIAHPETGPYVVAKRFRRDAGYRVFDGAKQVFARPIELYLEERGETARIADEIHARQMDEMDALADRYGISVEETRGGMKTLRVNSHRPKRIYSK
jgi:hypothetical protein